MKFLKFEILMRKVDTVMRKVVFDVLLASAELRHVSCG